MVNYAPSTSSTVVHTAEYCEETAEFFPGGVFPTNPTMLWVGADLQYDDTPDMKTILTRNLGNEDVQHSTKGPETYSVTMSYAPQDSAFMRRFTNSAGGGTGTVDKTIALLISPKINSTTEYLMALGCRPDTFSLKMEKGKNHAVSCDVVAKSIPAYVSTDPVGSGTHASDPGSGSPPWKWDDPGPGGLTLAATGYDFIDFSLSVKRNVEGIMPLGYSQLKYDPVVNRDVTGDFTVMLEDPTIYDTYFLTQALQSVGVAVKASVSQLTLANVSLNKASRTFKIGSVFVEKYNYTAQTATLT